MKLIRFLLIFQWHVGDNCRAVYSEDELIYDAVIISLDASSNTYIVRFCGYGNKEEQNLDDLLPPLSKKRWKVSQAQWKPVKLGSVSRTTGNCKQ